MSNKTHEYGNMSEEERNKTQELILDILVNDKNEDELSTELGDNHTEEMWLLGILQELEDEGKIISYTTYRTIE
jgi:hypothetical protein